MIPDTRVLFLFIALISPCSHGDSKGILSCSLGRLIVPLLFI